MPATGAAASGGAKPSVPPTGGAQGQRPGGAAGGGSSTGSGGSGRPPSPPPAQSGGGSWVKGLIGGLVGGAAAWAGINYGLEQPTPQVQALQAEIAELQSQVGQAGGGATADLDSLQATIEDTQARLDAIESDTPGGGSESAVAEIQSRLDALEGELGDLGSQIEQAAAGGTQTPTEAAGGADLAALQAEIEALSARVGQVEQGGGEGGAPDATAFAALETQVGDIAAQINEIEGNLSESDGAQGAGEQLSALSGEVESLRSEIGGQMEGAQGSLSALQERMESLSARVDALEEELDLARQRIDEVSLQRQNAATVALATSRMRSALVDGEPYAETLEQLTPVAADDPRVSDALEGLLPAADDGVRTMAELRDEFHQIANDVVHQTQAPGDESLLDRATGNLMRLVSVRRVGEDVEGSGPGAVVARAEAKLEAGDLQAAVQEVESLSNLPEAASTWLEHARARLDALAAQNALETHAGELLTQARS